jgi:tetratricopeptide (TPR) repeat protein
VANRALEHAAEPDLLVDLHWTLAQCRMLAGESAESLATLDRALASPGITARHRARLLVLAARTYSYLGEQKKAGQVADSALAAASKAGDDWAMGWALHVLAMVTGVQAHPTDALPLIDRALAVTQSDPALTDLRLLLQINKAVALGDLDHFEEALAVAGQARHLAGQVGMTMRLVQAHSAHAQLLFETGRWDDALAEVEILPENLKEPDAACIDLGIAAIICFHRGDTGAARRHLAAAVPHAQLLGQRPVGAPALALRPDRGPHGTPPKARGALTDAFDATENSRKSRICWPTPSGWPPPPATWAPRRPSQARPPPWPPYRRSRTGKRTRSIATACWTTTPPACSRPRSVITRPAGR